MKMKQFLLVFTLCWCSFAFAGKDRIIFTGTEQVRASNVSIKIAKSKDVPGHYAVKWSVNVKNLTKNTIKCSVTCILYDYKGRSVFIDATKSEQIAAGATKTIGKVQTFLTKDVKNAKNYEVGVDALKT